MSLFAIADLHLAFSVPDKNMEVFGQRWKSYTHLIETHWKETVTSDDLVLIAGDISWAKYPEDAKVDLNWIHNLPGTKLLLKGNHDYWWTSLNKLKEILPPSLHLLQNNSFNWNGISIAGARLWDTDEYNYLSLIDYTGEMTTEDPEEQERIFLRELGRLELSLKSLDKNASHKVAMTHYPPIGPDLSPSRASMLLEKYGVTKCVFGHIHNARWGNKPLLGSARGVDYHLVAGDYLKFKPLKLL